MACYWFFKLVLLRTPRILLTKFNNLSLKKVKPFNSINWYKAEKNSWYSQFILKKTANISPYMLSRIYAYFGFFMFPFQYIISSFKQTEAVDCEALSTPDFRMEIKGENIKLIIVLTYILEESDSASKQYFPKSMRTRAQACWTVFVESEKYKWSISINLKTVFMMVGLGLSMGSMRSVLKIYAIIEKMRISCYFVLLDVPSFFNDFKTEMNILIFYGYLFLSMIILIYLRPYNIIICYELSCLGMLQFCQCFDILLF